MGGPVPETRADADLMALAFLRDHGPHTMEPIEDESAFAAALVFVGLVKSKLAASVNFGGGRVQFAITAEGRLALSRVEAIQ